jgi:hypothetical protein
MHELGLAVDFTCDGSLVARGDRCFHCLADPAIAIAVWVDGSGAVRILAPLEQLVRQGSLFTSSKGDRSCESNT